MNRYFTVVFFSIVALCAHAQHPDNVMQVLLQTGENRKGLESLLEDYAKYDKQKYEAACFLIANLPYNSQRYRLVKSDTRLQTFLERADSLYFQLAGERSDTALYNEYFNKRVLAPVDQTFRKTMEQQRFEAPEVELGEFCDVKHIDAAFLNQHIEHAFSLRGKSPFSARLSIKDFMQYVLPYRALSLANAQPANDYADIYSKYLHADTAKSVRNVVWRYNVTANRFRYWGGRYPFKQPMGLKEMFFLGRHDCVPTADFCTMILRACGVPAAIEYNVAYKFWQGRHYHVSVPTDKGWETFSPESGLPKYRDPNFYECLNLFRINFSVQPDNPFSLRGEDEPLPDVLSDPRIEDVTHNVGKVVKMELPFKAQTNHKLAYLASFHSSDLGVRPVTWGVIDQENQKVMFENVVPDHLYLPIFLDDEGDFHAFNSPFLLYADSLSEDGYRMQPVIAQKEAKVIGRLERKFPRKPNLIEVARKVPGTYVIASNDAKFLKVDTLGVITRTPSTSWEELELKTSRPYQYYRVCGSGTPPRVRLAEIQFLTKREYDYPNVIEVALPTSPWVRLMDEPLDKCKWKAEYDGNPQTAPDAWPNVTLKLQSPQYVHRLRYMAKHADNAVKSGVRYELRAWSDGYWKKVKNNLLATADILDVPDMIPGQLYWLRQMNGGKEEMPFIVDEAGKQHFLQYSFLEKLMRIKGK